VRLAGQFLERLARGVEEARLQQQVLGRVAGKRQLRQHHERGTLVPRAGDALGDLARVAPDVPDDGVDLREGHAEQVSALGHVSPLSRAARRNTGTEGMRPGHPLQVGHPDGAWRHSDDPPPTWRASGQQPSVTSR
jgi:hypothetical protein